MKKRLFCTLAALLCTVALLAADVAPALAGKVTQKDIDALKDSASSLDKKQKEIETKLKELKNDKTKALQRKDLLDQQIANTQEQIANTDSQIADYNAWIVQAVEELNEAQQQEAEQYDLFCRRVREMEKRGTVRYWSVLFKAESFSDLLSRLDIINEIMDYDQRVIDGLKEMQTQIAGKKADLEDTRSQLQAVRSTQESQKKQLSAQRDEANALVREINSNTKAYQATLADLEAEEKRIEQQIKDLQKKLEEQMRAEGKNFNSNPGGYIWPVDSRYITSTMGGRNSPGGVGSTNHQGTDIGRVGYTSPVYAAKTGIVIVSERSSSYGHYIVISHGSGNSTLYAHLSSRKVKVGDTVQQGQTIGITGSTGHSTGPHLHFEVVEGGVRVNPLSHGATPQKGYLTGYTLSKTA